MRDTVIKSLIKSLVVPVPVGVCFLLYCQHDPPYFPDHISHYFVVSTSFPTLSCEGKLANIGSLKATIIEKRNLI